MKSREEGVSFKVFKRLKSDPVDCSQFTLP